MCKHQKGVWRKKRKFLFKAPFCLVKGIWKMNRREARCMVYAIARLADGRYFTDLFFYRSLLLPVQCRTFRSLVRHWTKIPTERRSQTLGYSTVCLNVHVNNKNDVTGSSVSGSLLGHHHLAHAWPLKRFPSLFFWRAAMQTKAVHT